MILVTGGAGYIGSHVLKKLLEKKFQVVILDNLSTGRKESLLGGELIVGDLNDRDLLEKIFSKYKFDGCLHFAGSIVVPDSVSDPLAYYRNNTGNSLQLLEVAKKYKLTNFIFSSTAAVYGDPMPGKVLDENHPIRPMSPYGWTKYMTEQMLKDLTFSNPYFRYIALRYFNVAGAAMDGGIGQCTPNATHLIKVASQVALGLRPSLSVFGSDYETKDGTCIRDYIHIDDLAEAHVLALEYLLSGGSSDVLNCGYGKGNSVNDVVKTMKEVSGVDFKVDYVDRRPGDPASVVSHAQKIVDKLGFKPKYNDLKLICESALKWEKHYLTLSSREQS